MEFEHQHERHLRNPNAEPDCNSGHTDAEPNRDNYTHSYSKRDCFTEHDALQQRRDCGRRV
jgi:hypothetical protein